MFSRGGCVDERNVFSKGMSSRTDVFTNEARTTLTNMLKDIESEADIRKIIDAFYHRIDEDPLIGRYFAGLDMQMHLPKMYAFWSSIVFQTGTYRGRPLDAHLRLDALAPAHFSQWLHRFVSTIDAGFMGERTDLMKEKAYQIGTIFQIKMGLEPSS